jgi:hypothetical protein
VKPCHRSIPRRIVDALPRASLPSYAGVHGGLGAVVMPAWAHAMQAGIQASIDALRTDIHAVGARVDRLQNRNVSAAADVITPIPGALAPFALPAAAVPPVHFPADLAGFGALTTAQARFRGGKGHLPARDAGGALLL